MSFKKKSWRWTSLAVAAALIGMAGTAGAANIDNDDDEGFRTVYKVGDGLSIGDGSNLVHIQGRVQTRFTFSGLEGTKSTDNFSVSRGEIRLDGFTLDKKIRFGFEMNLATRNPATTTTVCADAGCAPTTVLTSSSTSGLATLNDYYIDWVPNSYIGIQAGQFKVPFLIQQLTSSTRQQFVDRSLATAFFDFARDIGVSVHGSLPIFEETPLNYAVFVMNGEGANSINRNKKSLMVGTRWELPILGEYKYSETDVEYSEDHNLGFGVAYVFNEGNLLTQSGTVPAFTKTHNFTFDAGYKHRGFSFQGAGMLTRASESPTKLTNWGYNAQVGYFFVPKFFEVALRAGGSIFSNATTNQYEYAAGVNLFPWRKGHGVKFQIDYTLLKNNRGPGLMDHRIRTAMNLIF